MVDGLKEGAKRLCCKNGCQACVCSLFLGHNIHLNTCVCITAGSIFDILKYQDTCKSSIPILRGIAILQYFLYRRYLFLYGTLSNALVKSRMAISTDFFSSRDLLMSWTV